MAQMTAVEWFMSKIIDGEIDPSTNAIFLKRHINKVEVYEQAKRMHEEQIKDAHANGYNNGYSFLYGDARITCEEYFEQTFKK